MPNKRLNIKVIHKFPYNILASISMYAINYVDIMKLMCFSLWWLCVDHIQHSDTSWSRELNSRVLNIVDLSV